MAGPDGEVYRELVAALPDQAAVQLDDDGIVRGWYAASEQITGYTAAEMIGRSAAVLYPDQDGRKLLAEEIAGSQEAGRFDVMGWRVGKDGRRFWASVTVVRLGSGGHLKLIRDTTARQEQDVAMRGIEQMLDSISDYEIIRLDTDGTVLSWTPGAEKLRQYTAAEAIGQSIRMFYSEEDARRGVPERELAAAVRDGGYEGEGWRLRRDGSRFWANDVLTPIRSASGELLGFVKITRDQSGRREQEELVARQRDEILELSTPVIQVWDDVLVLPVIGTLDSARAARLTENLLERIARDQAEVVILDVSGVPAVDTEVAQHLLKTVEAARLMGSVSVLSGIRPETAQAIVHLGIELGTLRCRSNLKDALQLALRLVGARPEVERPTVDA
jgi:rsbT co-antagonist protein RsbR